MMSGTKGAAKAVQGACNICGHDYIYWSMVNTDDEYYLQANTRSTRSRWDRHQLIPSSPFEKNKSFLAIFKYENVFLVTKYESMFYMPDYQTHDLPRFYWKPTFEHALLQISADNWDRRCTANCLRTALASTTTPLEQVQRKRSKKTEEMLVQGRHPSSKMTTSKTLSSKTASPVRLSIPMHRWVLLSWPFALSLHIIIDWYVFSSEKLNDLMREPLPQLFQEVPSTLPTRRWR